MMKVQDYRGRTYTVRETIKAEIQSSDHGEGQIEMLRNSVDRLTDYVATLIQILADNQTLNEATVLNMCGYGSAIIEPEEDKTDAE
jgi:hypothetical protein